MLQTDYTYDPVEAAPCYRQAKYVTNQGSTMCYRQTGNETSQGITTLQITRHVINQGITMLTVFKIFVHLQQTKSVPEQQHDDELAQVWISSQEKES